MGKNFTKYTPLHYQNLSEIFPKIVSYDMDSWYMIVTEGRFGEVIWAGIDFYNRLIDALLLKGNFQLLFKTTSSLL